MKRLPGAQASPVGLLAHEDNKPAISTLPALRRAAVKPDLQCALIAHYLV
jgi:hypothetical protein